MTTIGPSFLNGSLPFLQVMRTCIKAWMSLKFGRIPPLTTELADLERLKIDVSTRFFGCIYPIIFKLAGYRTCSLYWISSNFGQIRPPTTELAVIECLKYTHILVSGEDGVFLCCFLSDPFEVFKYV